MVRERVKADAVQEARHREDRHAKQERTRREKTDEKPGGRRQEEAEHDEASVAGRYENALDSVRSLHAAAAAPPHRTDDPEEAESEPEQESPYEGEAEPERGRELGDGGIGGERIRKPDAHDRTGCQGAEDGEQLARGGAMRDEAHAAVIGS